MKVSNRVYQASNQVQNTSREYSGKTTVLRESIVSLSLRIFFAEFIIGLIGLGLRIPLLYASTLLTGALQTYAIYGLVYFVFQIINLALILFILLDWYNRTYVIREKDISIKSGVFSLKEDLLQYDNMERVQVSQSLLGRLGNYGTIEIYNPLLRTNTSFRDIPEPRMYAEKIQEVVPKNGNQRIVITK